MNQSDKSGTVAIKLMKSGQNTSLDYKAKWLRFVKVGRILSCESVVNLTKGATNVNYYSRVILTLES